MHSSYISQDGCKVDLVILKRLALKYADKIKGYEEYVATLRTSDEVFKRMDGWKIQGYFYEPFTNLLQLILHSVKDLTIEAYENQVHFAYEENTAPFWFSFLLEDGIPKLEIEGLDSTAMPIPYRTMKVEDKGHLLAQIKRKIRGSVK